MIRTRRALCQTLKACSLSVASSGPGALGASSTLEMDSPEAPTQRKKRSGPKSKTSPYIGVTQYKKTLRWEAHIWIADSSGKGKGGQKHLGSYNTAEEAARCYDRAAIKTRGPTAELNFPYEEYKSDDFMKEHSRLSREPFLKLMREVFALKPVSIMPPKKGRPAAPAKPAPAPRPRPVPLTSASRLSNSSSPSDSSTQGEPTLHSDLPETPNSWSNGQHGQQHHSGGSGGNRGGCSGAHYFASTAIKMEAEEAQQQGALGPRTGSVHSALMHMGAGADEELLALDHLDDLLLVNPMAQHEEGGLWGGCQLLPPNGQPSAEALALQPLHCPVKQEQQEQQEAGEQHRMMLPAAALVPSGGLLLLDMEREQFSDLLLQPPAAKVPRITSTPAGPQLLSLELTATAGWAAPAAQHFLAQQRSPQPLPLSLSPPPQLSLPPLPHDFSFFPNASLGIAAQRDELRAGQAHSLAAAAPTFGHGTGQATPAGQWFSEQQACPARAWDF